MEAPEISEEEIRKQIMEEFELKEKIKMAQLEEEIKRAEQEKQEEIRGKKNIQEPIFFLTVIFTGILFRTYRRGK